MQFILDDVNNSTQNGSLDCRSSTSNQKLAQLFVPSVNCSISKVILKLQKVGNPTGNVYVEIYNNSGGPNALVNNNSDVVDVSTLDSSGADQAFLFSTNPPQLVAGQSYWIVLTGSFSVSSSNFIRAFARTPNYRNDALIYNGSSWSTASSGYSLYFEEYRDAISSPSASLSPSASISPSLSPSASLSPSSSISASLSPSASRSPSSSTSASLSPSSSVSLSVSPSASVSPSTPPGSPSLSPSSSESVSISPSPSVSPSSSVSFSSSPSASLSPSSSPSIGYSAYSRGNYMVLPSNDADLEVMYTETDEQTVTGDDNARVDQDGALQYLVHQFKNFVGERNYCQIDTVFYSTLSARQSPIFFEIFNRTQNLWETLDINNQTKENKDTHFLKVLKDLTNYKDADNIISCRIYQLAI